MLKQQVSIITGGSRGIGEAIAMRLSLDTAVLLTGRSDRSTGRNHGLQSSRRPRLRSTERTGRDSAGTN